MVKEIFEVKVVINQTTFGGICVEKITCSVKDLRKSPWKIQLVMKIYSHNI